MNPTYLRGPLRSEEPGSEPTGGAPAAVTADDIAEIRGQLQSLQTENEELRQTAEYWEKKRGAQQSDDGGDDDDPTPDIEAINKKGFKAFAEQGFVTRDELDQYVQQGVNKALADKELTDKYPDLRSTDSDLFRATAKHYELLKGAPHTQRLAAAAKLAEADLRQAGKYREPENETQRLARIMAQQSSTLGGSIGGNDSDELTPSQRGIAEAFGISPEKYAEQAKKGVTLSR